MAFLPPGKSLLFLLMLGLAICQVSAQSVPLATDRARVKVASIPDPYDSGFPALKVLRTDADTPLRAGTAWIWEKDRQEEPESYYTSMRAKGLNAVRMILFDTWEKETYPPSSSFTPTDWNDAAYRTRQLARMGRAVDYASAHGLYVIINSHDHIPSYDETYATALWNWVAPYFANRTHVLYEASNEPLNGIGNNGNLDQTAPQTALDSPRLQALKRVYNVIRSGAPDTHILVITPPGINDYNVGTGLGNVAQSFATLPGAVDWTKTSVAYHLYGTDGSYANNAQAQNLRNFHSRFPGWPSENNFPPSVSSADLGITDNERSASFGTDVYVNQTCERLGLGWSMWNINGQVQLDHNWPIMMADATAKGWNWASDVLPTAPPVFTSGQTAIFSQGLAGAFQISATGGSITYSANGLPAGLLVDPVTGLLQGTTAAAGKFSLVLNATNSVGTTTAPLALNVRPTDDLALYAEAFAAGTTAGWFSYSGGAGVSASLTAEAAGTTDGRALKLAIQAPNSWYAGMGITLSGAPPFSASTLSRVLVQGRLQVVGPSATSLSVVLKTPNGQSLALPLAPPAGAWMDFSVPLSSFTDSGFDYTANSWQILLVPNSGAWGVGNPILRLDHLEILRRDDIADPLLGWRKIYFGSPTANTGAYADTADFDRDQITNLVEYALGGDPTKPGQAPTPLVSLDASNRLRLTFQCDASLTNIAYIVQSSPDLSTWSDVARSTGGAPTAAINASGCLITDAGSAIRSVTVTLPTPVPPNARKFLRLRISLL